MQMLKYRINSWSQKGKCPDQQNTNDCLKDSTTDITCAFSIWLRSDSNPAEMNQI